MDDKITFFNDYWPALEAHGWKALILHTWQDMPEQIPSDVDYAVSGPSPKELLTFIRGYCEGRGWLLAQVIEHEPDAYFCLCVQSSGEFETVALDVTWEYRRLGHKLVSAETLFNNRFRPSEKSFYVTSCGAELCYILAKGAAKNKDYREIKSRVLQLLKEDEKSCLELLRWEFGAELSLDRIEAWYENTPCFQGVRKGHHYGWKEVMLYLRRIMQPTGFWMSFKNTEICDSDLSEFEATMPPLFRQQHRVGRVTLFNSFGTMMKLVRTRLVLETGGAFASRFIFPSSRLVFNEDFEDVGGSDTVNAVLIKMSERVAARITLMKSV